MSNDTQKLTEWWPMVCAIQAILVANDTDEVYHWNGGQIVVWSAIHGRIVSYDTSIKGEISRFVWDVESGERYIKAMNGEKQKLSEESVAFFKSLA